MEVSSCDKDLPLMANANDILVNHYVFNLFCDFDAKKLCGSVDVLLQPLCGSSCNSVCLLNEHSQTVVEDDQKLEKSSEKVKNNMRYHTSSDSTLKSFLFILDCTDIEVTSVKELTAPDSKFSGISLENKEIASLEFSVEKWCLKIWKPGVHCSCQFPTCVRISYETSPQGQSLLWVPDQDRKPAVYTYGAWINNRSMFPCQEPPTAMATWEATISVKDPAIVVMSGDEPARQTSDDGVTSYYYFTKMKLPLSTLALAIGHWQVEDLVWDSVDLAVHVRLCASSSLLERATKEFSGYIYSCLKAAESVLGAYPFQRIDFLIVPRGFASLGMASPNVIFISQSLLAGDGSMCCRIAHEISHAWFGLLIGASDWTEEWLSEGFATFAEDIIHAKAMEMTEFEGMEYYEVKAFMRWKTLCAEMKNTREELHVLRPNKGEVLTESIDGVAAVILKNGKDPEKSFMQVHYIKGYFLLKYLSDFVGGSSFLEFLNLYIRKFRGQLVDSMEMLTFYCETFSEQCKDVLTVDKIALDWLHNSKLPKVITGLKIPPTNSIYQRAVEEAEKWSRLNRSCLTRKSKKRRKFNADHFAEVSSEVLLLMLDFMLRKEVLSETVLKMVSEVYHVKKGNAEVRHKWLEMVVKHRYYPGYGILKDFLKNDLAMGIYLYGELILCGTRSQKELAELCFRKIRSEMEPNCLSTITEMFKQVINEAV